MGTLDSQFFAILLSFKKESPMECKVVFWFVSESPGLNSQIDECHKSHVIVMVDLRVVFFHFWLTTLQTIHVKISKNLWKSLVFCGTFVQGLGRYRPQFSDRNGTAVSAIISSPSASSQISGNSSVLLLVRVLAACLVGLLLVFYLFGFLKIYFFRDASFQSFCWEKLTIAKVFSRLPSW